jgi:hypothetical protein
MPRCLILAAMLVSATPVFAECVLQTKTTTASEVVAEKGDVSTNLVTMPAGDRKCLVTFRARVGDEYHFAAGEAAWDGRSDPGVACGKAVKDAEKRLIESVSPTALRSEQALICNDNPRLSPLSGAAIGTKGDLSQFRPHPGRPELFWHNGTQCRWILDTVFESQKIQTFQGIVCNLAGSEWVVVDKF